MFHNLFNFIFIFEYLLKIFSICSSIVLHLLEFNVTFLLVENILPDPVSINSDSSSDVSDVSEELSEEELSEDELTEQVVEVDELSEEFDEVSEDELLEQVDEVDELFEEVDELFEEDEEDEEGDELFFELSEFFILANIIIFSSIKVLYINILIYFYIKN